MNPILPPDSPLLVPIDGCAPQWVVEFHYADGDVGAHPAGAHELALVRQFSMGHAPSHIVIRHKQADE